jgi:hypothetical protein
LDSVPYFWENIALKFYTSSAILHILSLYLSYTIKTSKIHLFETNILIYYVFCTFQTRGFIARKTLHCLSLSDWKLKKDVRNETQCPPNCISNGIIQNATDICKLKLFQNWKQ